MDSQLDELIMASITVTTNMISSAIMLPIMRTRWLPLQ